MLGYGEGDFPPVGMMKLLMRNSEHLEAMRESGRFQELGTTEQEIKKCYYSIVFAEVGNIN
jgi:hypothetical protein